MKEGLSSVGKIRRSVLYTDDKHPEGVVLHIEIDVEELWWMAQRAVKSKRGMSTALHGAVKLKVAAK